MTGTVFAITRKVNSVNDKQLFVKRFFDLFFSIIGLILCTPIILVCAVIARISTGSTGIFVQNRVGQHGKIIRVKKIRTMRIIDGMSSTVTVVGDARITRVGSWMRCWKLDELPQLWNVLVGDMSFVGPRPDVPGYADKLAGRELSLIHI